MILPNSVRKLIDELSELPSLGPRQATRLAFHLVSRGTQSLELLAGHLRDLARVKTCERCFFVHENATSRCAICSDPDRMKGSIMVLEKETDLLSIENTGKFKGVYFIIGPIGKTGMLEEWQNLRIASLKKVIERDLDGVAEEIIIGFNPSAHGDWNASSIKTELEPLAKKISRLGRGLPMGGEIEFADDDTLNAALERRS